jgi:hypothetical protein
MDHQSNLLAHKRIQEEHRELQRRCIQFINGLRQGLQPGVDNRPIYGLDYVQVHPEQEDSSQEDGSQVHPQQDDSSQVHPQQDDSSQVHPQQDDSSQVQLDHSQGLQPGVDNRPIYGLDYVQVHLEDSSQEDSSQEDGSQVHPQQDDSSQVQLDHSQGLQPGVDNRPIYGLDYVQVHPQQEDGSQVHPQQDDSSQVQLDHSQVQLPHQVHPQQQDDNSQVHPQQEDSSQEDSSQVHPQQQDDSSQVQLDHSQVQLPQVHPHNHFALQQNDHDGQPEFKRSKLSLSITFQLHELFTVSPSHAARRDTITATVTDHYFNGVVFKAETEKDTFFFSPVWETPYMIQDKVTKTRMIYFRNSLGQALQLNGLFYPDGSPIDCTVLKQSQFQNFHKISRITRHDPKTLRVITDVGEMLARFSIQMPGKDSAAPFPTLSFIPFKRDDRVVPIKRKKRYVGPCDQYGCPHGIISVFNKRNVKVYEGKYEHGKPMKNAGWKL